MSTIKLSQRDENFLSKVPVGPARDAARAVLVKEAQDRAEKNDAFLIKQKERNSQPLKVETSPAGLLVIQHSGTRYGFMVLDKEHANQLLAQIEVIRGIVNSMK